MHRNPISRTLVPLTLITFGGCGMVILPADPDASSPAPLTDANSESRTGTSSPDAAPAIVDAAPVDVAPPDALPDDAAPVDGLPVDASDGASACGFHTGGYGIHVFEQTGADPTISVSVEGGGGQVLISGNNLVTHGDEIMPGLGVLGGSSAHLDPGETLHIDWSPDIRPAVVRWKPAVGVWITYAYDDGNLRSEPELHDSGHLVLNPEVRWLELVPDVGFTRLTEVSYCQ